MSTPSRQVFGSQFSLFWKVGLGKAAITAATLVKVKVDELIVNVRASMGEHLTMRLYSLIITGIVRVLRAKLKSLIRDVQMFKASLLVPSRTKKKRTHQRNRDLFRTRMRIGNSPVEEIERVLMVEASRDTGSRFQAHPKSITISRMPS